MRCGGETEGKTRTLKMLHSYVVVYLTGTVLDLRRDLRKHSVGETGIPGISKR